MPVYVYQCDSCGVIFERQQSFSDAPLTGCPECEGCVHRVIQPVGIVFKGSGFYVTDNRAKSSTALSGAGKSETKESSPSSDSDHSNSDS
jgi:putative FmdB family regulatory protein